MIKYKYPPATQVLANDLKKHSRIILQQLTKHANLLGDHHYQITNENNFHIAHASEQLEGLLSQIKRLFLNFRRSFEIRLYNSQGEHALTLRHPFRWIYNRFEIYDVSGKRLGTISRYLLFLLMLSTLKIQMEKFFTNSHIPTHTGVNTEPLRSLIMDEMLPKSKELNLLLPEALNSHFKRILSMPKIDYLF